MRNDKDSVIEQTPTQSNPYAARPEDFEVERADAVPGHGQHGENESEYNQLLKEADLGKSPFSKKA